MSTEPIAKLTPKQRQVHDLLVKGVAPAEIAKKLKISPSGVYGHKRNIEQALGAPIQTNGDAPTASAADPISPSPAQVSSGGTGTSFTFTNLPQGGEGDPAQVLQAAIARASARATEIDEAILKFTQEREVIAERLTKYAAAAEALA